MSFNKRAIEMFGEENKAMTMESSWAGIDEQQGKLQTYLDFQVVKRWVLDRAKLDSSEICVLDVGAGKGRMTRCFASNCSHVVSIEPFTCFYECLEKVEGNFPNVEVYNTTLFEYADNNWDKGKFDLIYASGVTPYFDDSELDVFFKKAKDMLSCTGYLIVRELGSAGKTICSSRQINRSREHMINAAGRYRLDCVGWACAYPMFLFNWLRKRHPNAVTDNLRRASLQPVFYPLWDMFARLNIPTRWKIPRGQTKDYYVYLFKNLS